MIKIGMADGQTIVTLTNQEFTGLAGKTTSNFPDGSEISLAPIKAKLDLVDSKEAELLEIKTLCSVMEAKLTSIGI